MTEFEKFQMYDIKEDFLKETGEFIAKKRKYRNLTQKELGEYLEVAATTVSRYENGEIEIPGSNLAVISSVCGFPMREYTTAWDSLELKDIFKKSLELIKKGKQRTCKDYTSSMRYDYTSLIGDDQELYPETDGPDNKEIDLMISLCSEDDKEDIIVLGTALDRLENEDLRQKLTIIMIENQLSRFAESGMKERAIRYYEMYTKRMLGK